MSKIETQSIMPAYPVRSNETIYFGLSKREYFAAQAMQGICSQFQEVDALGGWQKGPNIMYHAAAKHAVAFADALIEELNK